MKTPINIHLPPSGSVSFLMDMDASCIVDQCTVTAFNSSHGCEPEIVHLMLRVLKPGDIAIDGGANIGFFTMLMAKLVGETGRVYAFEPSEQNIHKLAVNTHVNGFENITIVSNPLWSKVEPVTLYMAENSGFTSLAKSPISIGQVEKQGITLGAYFKDPPPITLLKLDVEGSELHALKGCHLRYPPYIICELNAEALQLFGMSTDRLRIYMHNAGMNMFILHPDGRFPTLLPLSVDIGTNKMNLNVLFSTMENVVKAWPSETVNN